MRTWLQGYDSTKEPYVVYNASKMQEMINALHETGNYDGLLIWNAGSSIAKYDEFSSVIE